MSFSISGDFPSQWADLSETSTAASSSPATSSEPLTEHDWQLALSPQAFFNGVGAFRAFLPTEQSLLARQECDAALRCLEAELAGSDHDGRLRAALRGLGPLMRADEEQHAQMMGHGKRWLSALLKLLRDQPPPEADRRTLCVKLGDSLAGDGAQPARAIGGALAFLRAVAQGGRDAQAIRRMLHANTLASYLRADATLSGNKDLIDNRLQDLLTGFGFKEARGRPSEAAVLPGATALPERPLTAAQLNSAAHRLEEKQRAHLLLIAHEILNRVQTAFTAIWDHPAPSVGMFRPGQDAEVQRTLEIFGTSLHFDLRRLLEPPPVRGGQARSWDLHDASPLATRLGEQLPELRSSEARVMMSGPPASWRHSSHHHEASPGQDSDAGGAGVFNGGTGGAKRRDPS